MNTENSIRAFSFLSGVLRNQQRDPLCGSCKAWVNSVTAVRDRLAKFLAEHEAGMASLKPEFCRSLEDTAKNLRSVVLPENAVGQKKAGNCLMPPGVCFVKHSLRIFDIPDADKAELKDGF